MAYTPTTWVDGSEPAITATRLNNMETGIYQAHELLNTHKSSADHDGRYYTKSQLNTSGGGGAVHWNNVTSKPSIPSNPVPVTQLKKAQGSLQVSASTSTQAEVHQYAFASPFASRGETSSEARIDKIGLLRGGSASDRRWEFSNGGSQVVTWTWDYLTASGHPRVWAEVDERGEIISMWEAEDPADPEFPDEPPFEPREGRVLVPVEPPDSTLLDAVAQRLDQATIPHGFRNSIYAADPPPRAVRAMLSRQLAERGLEEPHDIREALSIADRDRMYWYLQLYMRQASRLLHDHRASTLIPLYREMCRVDPTSGRLQLQ